MPWGISWCVVMVTHTRVKTFLHSWLQRWSDSWWPGAEWCHVILVAIAGTTILVPYLQGQVNAIHLNIEFSSTQSSSKLHWGNYNTQELPCSIRVANNPWPVKISHPVANHKVDLAPEALKMQGLCDEYPDTWYFLVQPLACAISTSNDCG